MQAHRQIHRNLTPRKHRKRSAGTLCAPVCGRDATGGPVVHIRRFGRTLAAACLVIAAAGVANRGHAASYLLDTFEEGTYLDPSLVGGDPHTDAVTLTGITGSTEGRSYFVFDIPDIAGRLVSAATLRATNTTYLSSDPTETFVATFVSTQVSALLAATSPANTFLDLGTGGSTYGSTVVSAPATPVVSVALNATARNQIEFKLGAAIRDRQCLGHDRPLRQQSVRGQFGYRSQSAQPAQFHDGRPRAPGRQHQFCGSQRSAGRHDRRR